MHNSSVPLFWRLKKARYMLTGTKCTACKNVYFPPRKICPECRRKSQIEDMQFSGKGEIVSYTIIRTPPAGFEEYVPYAIALIRLDEGTVITGQMIGDPENVEIGKRVKSVFRKMYTDGAEGLIHYGMKFQLDE